MENLGINILGSDEFCSDIAALFIKHIWQCDDCLSLVFGYLVAFFFFCCIFLLLIITVSCLIERLFSKIFDRFRYKKLYDDLITLYGDLQEDYDELSQDLSSLKSSYDELEVDYYYTCNL